jgi:peptide/nickel transport system substrate-binding protein
MNLRMKRRFLTQAMAVGAFWRPAFADTPLPALQETPIFADQVKSGDLPPVDKRIRRASRAVSATC